jgi:predicted RNase H-like HicB family nuclease
MVKLNTSFIKPNTGGLMVFLAEVKEQFYTMDYIDEALEKLKEWARKLIEALLGPEAQPEPEPIPVPVREPQRRR